MNRFIKANIFLLPNLILSSCVLAPGMHMDYNHNLVDREGNLTEVGIKEINATLINEIIRDETVKNMNQRENYIEPMGFLENSQGYKYKVGAQDILNIVVWEHPNLTNPNDSLPNYNTNSKNSLNQSFGITVDQNGNIFYPYVGEIHVAGLTTTEIRKLLIKKLSIYLKNPQINVTVSEFNSQKVAVVGVVQTPKVIPITNVPLTVLNAITQTGGPIRCGTNFQNNTQESLCSNLAEVTIKRGNKIVTVDLNKLETPHGNSENWILQDGDIVRVPSNEKSQVYILGAVNFPGPYTISSDSSTLRDIVGNSRGFSNVSSPEYTYIIRDSEKIPEVYSINLKSPENLLLAGRFKLKPKDIVFVSKSKLVQFSEVLNLARPAFSIMNETINSAVGINTLTK